MIYLDNAATTKPFKEILKNLSSWGEKYFGNPSSIYSIGQSSKSVIEKSRKFIAKTLNVSSEDIIFTSCATESNNTILKGIADISKTKNEIILSPFEHKSVLNTGKYLSRKGFKIKFVKIDKNGLIDIEDLKRKINSKTVLIGIIHVNNETGVIQDIKSIGKVAKEFDIPFFSDTVQSYIKEEIPTEYIDFLSVSGHKINAPKGIGFLKRNRSIDITPLLHGGGQEYGFRSGTENIIYIKALEKAVYIWIENREIFINKLYKLKRLFINGLKELIPDIKIVSEDVKTAPNIVNVIFPKIKAQDLILYLNSKNIFVSSGSACSSGSLQPSYVLLAYGFTEEETIRAVRFSFGVQNTEEDILTTLEEIKKGYTIVKRFLH